MSNPDAWHKLSVAKIEYYLVVYHQFVHFANATILMGNKIAGTTCRSPSPSLPFIASSSVDLAKEHLCFGADSPCLSLPPSPSRVPLKTISHIPFGQIDMYLYTRTRIHYTASTNRINCNRLFERNKYNLFL